MLELRNIMHHSAPFTFRANLTIARGEKVALMGQSGAGKSTLLGLIGGFITPDQGQIIFAGQDLTEANPAARPCAILFQDSNLFPHLNLRDNLGLAVSGARKRTASLDARIARALDKVGLAGFEERRPASLSGGQQSRAGIARVLLQDRPVLLMDEPFAALDPGRRREMAALISALCAELGLTLLLATHDFNDAEGICDRVILLEAGEIQADCPIKGLRKTAPAALKPWL